MPPSIKRILIRLIAAMAIIPTFAIAQSFDKAHMVYFPEWGIYARDHHVSELPAEDLSHIIYAFAQIGADNRIAIIDTYAAVDRTYGDPWDAGNRGNFHELRKLKAAHPHLKSIIAVGGWNHSHNFATMAASEPAREAFADSVVAFLRQHDFDGVDIDWEFPGGSGKAGNAVHAADRNHHALLMQALRDKLDAAGVADEKSYTVSYATIAGPQKIDHIDWAALADSCHWISLFGYDFHGGWENRSDHQSPLVHNPVDAGSDPRLNISWGIDAVVAAGFPADRIVLGAPLYGRGWRGVGTTNNGLWQPSTGTAPGTYESGVDDFKVLHALLHDPTKDYRRYWDDTAKTAWLHSPTEGGGTFWTYDDQEAMAAKIAFLNSRGLMGLMYWDASGDLPPDHPDAIIPHAQKLLNGEIARPLGFAQWRDFHGLANGGPDLDTDNDGLTDLAEFAVGTDPRHANPFPLDVGSISRSIDGQQRDYLSVRVVTNLLAAGITVSLELSPDLRTWQSAEGLLAVERTTNLPNHRIETVWRSIAPVVDLPYRFMRVAIDLIE